MARFRKRAPKVSWLPGHDGLAIGGAAAAGGTAYSKVFHSFVGPLGSGTAIFSAQPLTFDQPSLKTASQSLADMESSGYRLRRIVGKVWVDVEQQAAEDSGLYICCAALMVRRVDDTGVPLSSAIEVQPGAMAATQDPWIWRRSWLLANGLSTNLVRPGIESSDFCNHEGAALNDGPHLDQKTARIVRENERLFLEFSTIAVNAAAAATDIDIQYCWEARVLASMRTTTGNRHNASR